MTDKEILQSIRAGNSKDFAQIYEKYFERIYRYIYTKTYQKETTEDICSVTFIKALESISNFKGDGSKIISWLYKIASNQVIDFYRSQHREGNIDDLWDLTSESNVEIDLINKESFNIIHKYLCQLKKIEREILTLHLWEEYTFKKIAQILKLREGNCKMLYYRSLKKMKSNMQDTITVLTVFKPLISSGGNYDR